MTTVDNSLWSPSLFWDVRVADLSAVRHARWLVVRVLERGSWADWKQLLQLYGLEKIVSEAQQARALSHRSVEFLSVLSGVDASEFRCSIERV